MQYCILPSFETFYPPPFYLRIDIVKLFPSRNLLYTWKRSIRVQVAFKEIDDYRHYLVADESECREFLNEIRWQGDIRYPIYIRPSDYLAALEEYIPYTVT